MRKKLNRLILVLTTAITAAAIFEQLRRPREQRTWHGDVAGVPYDFRPPSAKRFRERWWNPEDNRLFTPRDFGVGWALNFYRAKEIVMQPAKTNGDG
jgi:hypothetical protein